MVVAHWIAQKFPGCSRPVLSMITGKQEMPCQNISRLRLGSTPIGASLRFTGDSVHWELLKLNRKLSMGVLPDVLCRHMHGGHEAGAIRK